MPDIRFAEDDMLVLAYLHEHAKGFGDKCIFSAEHVARDLFLSPEAMSKSVSYLTDLRFVGARLSHRRRDGVLVYREMFLTGMGENLVREVEEHNGVMRRMTVSAVREGWTVLKVVAASVLSEVLKRAI